MKAFDFEYDNIRLSDKGFTLCKFDSGGMETVSNGSEITFNTVPTLNGQKHQLTSSEYGNCLTTTLQICKNLCDDYDMEISVEDMRDIMRWLNRKEFHKFKIIDDEYINFYLNASFNVSRIEINGRLYGFELELFSDTPFMLHEPVVVNVNVKQSDLTDSCIMANGTPISNVCIKSIYSKSDEEGYIYPNMIIKIDDNVAGKNILEIYNITEDRLMRIANCVAGEEIAINYPMISSSYASHNNTLMNDFNWRFFRVATSFRDRKNDIAISLPCSIKITYSPIVKVGI